MPTTTTTFEAAEAALWASYGVEPANRKVRIDAIGCDVRLQIVGDGPPVVFIHGGMTAGSSWAPLVQLLPEFRCIVVDRPGCGLSDPLPNVSGSLADAARVGDALVAGVIEALDLPKAHVIGTSLGGWATLRGAAAHPDRYDRLVLMSYCFGMRPVGVPIFMRFAPIPLVMKHMARFTTPSMMRKSLGAAGMKRAIAEKKFSDEAIDWMVAVFRETDTAWNDTSRGLFPMTLRAPVEEIIFTSEQISRINAPTLIVWGGEDPMTTFDIGRQFAEQLPDGTIQLLPKAGHAPWVDEPTVVADAVRNHFNQTS